MAISIPSLFGCLRLWAAGSEDLLGGVEDTLCGVLSACPSKSVTPFVGCTLYVIPGANGAFGVKVAVRLSELTEMVPTTGAPPLGVRVNVVLVTVSGLIGWLN